MRRMFTEEAFISLGNDVDELKNKHLYIHQIVAKLTDSNLSYTGIIRLNIINTSSDELTTDFDTLKNGLKNYLYTCVYDVSYDAIGQLTYVSDSIISIYLEISGVWTEYEFDSIQVDRSSDTVIQLI